MPFAHTHCKETEGWQSRLGSKTGIAGEPHIPRFVYETNILLMFPH